MPGTVGIDFGTSNSVIAVWDEGRRQGRVPVLEGISREVRYRIGEEWHTVYTIPSLIAYVGDEVLIGEQVHARNLSEASCTFRWMKGYISPTRPIPGHRRIPGAPPCQLDVLEGTCRECSAKTDGGRLCNFVAARAFLSRVILYAADHCNLDEDELVFTMPVEAYEHYSNWISEVCDAAGVRRYRVLDEPTACVLGYERPVRQGQVFGVIDFGGGTLDVSIVRIDFESREGRKCTVLGKAGEPLGGRNVTQWLYEDFLKRCGAAAHTVGDISTQLLLEIEAAKETLSFDAKAGLNVLDGQTGKLYAADYERSTFEDLLTDRGLFNRLQAVLRAALRDAEDKGVDQEAVSQWLLVGGSTLIPAVRRTLQAQFGERLAYQKPFTSVALGACRFAAEGELIEWIQHDYAIRHYDKDRQTDDFRKLVKRGTPYPSDGPVARLPVSGVYDKQRELGIDIYELGDERTSAVGEVISFDQNGRVRKTKLRGGNHHFWINEHQRTFLEADPPANQDQHRFDLTFTVDGNKRLLMTAMDVVTRRLVYRDFPVAKLK